MKLNFILSAFLIGVGVQSYGMQAAQTQQMQQDDALQAIVEQVKKDKSIFRRLHLNPVTEEEKEKFRLIAKSMMFENEAEVQNSVFKLILTRDDSVITSVRAVVIPEENATYLYNKDGYHIQGEYESVLGAVVIISMMYAGAGLDDLMNMPSGKQAHEDVERVLRSKAYYSKEEFAGGIGNKIDLIYGNCTEELPATNAVDDDIYNYFRYGLDDPAGNDDRLELIQDELKKLNISADELSNMDIDSKNFKRMVNKITTLILEKRVLGSTVDYIIDENMRKLVSQPPTQELSTPSSEIPSQAASQQKKPPEFLDPNQPVDFSLFK